MTPSSPVFTKKQRCETRPVVFAKDQPEYIPLPAEVTGDGMVITRWKLTFRERMAVLFGGNLWLQVLTFRKPLQPVMISTKQPKLD